MIKLFHLSDLHFSIREEDNIYSIQQLLSIENVFEAEDADRIIITGDLTHDAEYESFWKAKAWLVDKGKMKRNIEGILTGLELEDSDRLKIMPGNKDFKISSDQKDKNTTSQSKTPEDRFYEGISRYNNVFEDKEKEKKLTNILLRWMVV